MGWRAIPVYKQSRSLLFRWSGQLFFLRNLFKTQLHFAVRKIGLYPIETVLPLNFVFVSVRSVSYLYVDE